MKKAFRNFVRQYFDFTKSERNAFIVLSLVTLIIALMPLFPFRNRHPVQTDFSMIKELQARSASDSGNNGISQESENFQEYPEGKVYGHKFNFDPNTATIGQLQSLGFSRYLAERVIKFRNSGGKFQIKSDITKIYGIKPAFADELLPYIDLPETREYKNENVAADYSSKKAAPQLIDINTADTFTLNKLKGIGNTLSMRIVGFRDKLGGFYSLDQLHEVYGLKPEVIEGIKPKLNPDFSPVRLININTATLEELGRHPYIKKNIAEVIVNYRKQHGDFGTINDLLKIKVLDENVFIKLKNYLKV